MEILASGGRLSPAAARKYEDTLATYASNVQRYDKEKTDIKDKAEALGRLGKVAQERAGDFGYGLIFLQISIMLSSVSALTRRKPLWYFGLAGALGGVFFFVDGVFLFY